MSPRRVVCSAPARANLIGNPSDQYGGCTLACCVPLRCRVVLDEARPGCIEAGAEGAAVASAGDLELRGDALDVGRAFLRHAGFAGPAPFGVRYESAIPRQSGMAGSTSLFVALLHALDVLRGRPRLPHALAEDAREAEARVLGVTCGYVDQYAVTFGGLVHVDLRGKAFDAGGDGPFATVEALSDLAPGLPFVLAFTGVRHHSGSVHRPLRERWKAGEPAVVAAYERIAEIGLLGKTALLRGHWDELGRLMDENHALQRDLGGSGESNERLIAAAKRAGAAGAKLAGAGDGGTIVALWPEADARPLEDALRKAGAAALYRPAPEPGVRVEPGA